MENSLRNHALVQQQNQLQQRNRDEYYRNNGIAVKNSPISPALSSSQGRPLSRVSGVSHTHSASNNSSSTNNTNHANANANTRSRSRISATTSSSSNNSRSLRSGEASDEAVQGNRHHPAHGLYQQTIHRQQHQPQHYSQQSNSYHYYNHHIPEHHHHQQIQTAQQQMHSSPYHLQQDLQQQYPRGYPQHHQYYSTSGTNPRMYPPERGSYYSSQSIHRGSYDSSSQHSGSNPHHPQHQHHRHPFQQQQNHYARQQQHYGVRGADADDHYSNILGSISSSHQSFGNGYRDGGTGIRSEGPSLIPPPIRTRFASTSTCFRSFRETHQEAIRWVEERNASSGMSNNSTPNSANLVRKMTLKANELYRIWYLDQVRTNEQQQAQHRRRTKGNANIGGMSASLLSRSSLKSKSSSEHRRSLSPRYRRSFAQMSLGTNSTSSYHSHASSVLSSSVKQPQGSLSAVIESASQNSNSTATRSTAAKNKRVMGTSCAGSVGGVSKERTVGSEVSEKSRASSSIATRSSLGTRTSIRSFGTLPPRGKCLTNPSEIASNDTPYDNTEGNLIVYENDTISVPRKQVHVLTKGKIPKSHSSSEFRVQTLLGQGTFAQVFKCLHTATGQLVALKIVKSKPAYTRQAAVEIDVIRVANESNNAKNAPKKSKDEYQQNQQKSPVADYMIDLVCYFMYKDHLCLVFELLGSNLYEVLKKRQFRGLPLSVTQTLVRQAVTGIRHLAQKSIVHCDLKPENILLVGEDDEASVMSAGESKRVLTSATETESSTLLSSHEKSSETSKNGSGSCKVSTNEGQSSDSSKDSKTKTDHSKNTGTVSTGKQATIRTELTTNSHSPMDSTLATFDTKVSTSSIEKIKLIDFGSACFEGQISHTYIQSRFYRSPEVLIGLPYDSAIDMWSLGCVAAELFLGLPILPGVHEHDQLTRIIEMIGEAPDWMLDQGIKSSKFFVKYFPSHTPNQTPSIQSPSIPSTQSTSASPDGRAGSADSSVAGTIRPGSEGSRPLPQWRIKTQSEYISSLSQSEIRRKGGLQKLEKQPGNRYFKRKLLSDIIFHKGQTGKPEDLVQLKYFVHFLYGVLDPDPWKRWTAYQASNHPFLTGATMEEKVNPSDMKDQNHANRLFNMYWEAPSDPTIYQRKLRSVQRTRERQQAARRSHNRSRSQSPSSQDGMSSLRRSASSRNVPSDTSQIVRGHMHEPNNNNHVPNLQNPQGSFIISSSLSELESNPSSQVFGYGSFVTPAPPVISGPQSFSEIGHIIGTPLYSEVDFALALYRPGVVPMGDSVTTETTSTTSLSSGNNSRSTMTHSSHHQIFQVGSFGSHPHHHYNGQQRRFPIGSATKTSRSFNEGDTVLSTSTAVPTIINPLNEQVLYGSSHDSKIDVISRLTLKSDALEPNTATQEDAKNESDAKSTDLESRREHSNMSSKNSEPVHDKDASRKNEPVAPAETTNPITDKVSTAPTMMGVFETQQAYQQHLAAMQQHFQQQQLFLQQQQAALVLQQEQLRAYYSAAGINAQHLGLGLPQATGTALPPQPLGFAAGLPGTTSLTPQQLQQQQVGLTPPSGAAPTLHAQQFGLPGATATTPGYYFLPAQTQGMGMPLGGQLPGIPGMPGIVPGNIPGMATPGAQLPGLNPTGLPQTSLPGILGSGGMMGGVQATAVNDSTSVALVSAGVQSSSTTTEEKTKQSDP